MGPGFLCQGHVTTPKAVEEETSNRMFVCPLCNNVTKLLMINTHNLRFRINGSDVWLALLPSHRLPALRLRVKYQSKVEDQQEANPYPACLETTSTDTPPHAGLDGSGSRWEMRTFQPVHTIFHTGQFGGRSMQKDNIQKCFWDKAVYSSSYLTIDMVHVPTQNFNHRPGMKGS